MKNQERHEDPKPTNENWKLIEEGSYKAQCYAFEIIEGGPFPDKKRECDQKRLYLNYVILEGPHKGTKLYEAINFIYSKFGPRTKYYNDWTIANGERPGKNTVMDPSIFEGKVFIVKVRTVEPKFDDGEPKPTYFYYSVVDRIEECLT